MDSGQQGLIVAVSGVAGGVIVKAIEWWRERGRLEADDATAIRKELRAEVKALRAELKVLTAEVDTWQARYYETAASLSRLQAEHQALTDRYREVEQELSELRARLAPVT